MNRDQNDEKHRRRLELFERLGAYCIVAIMILMVVGFAGSVMSMGFDSVVSWYWTVVSNMIFGGGG